MRKCLIIFLIMFLFTPILSACWNQKELTDLAFVMALGVDKGESKRYDVSFQVVNPANVALGQSVGGQGLPIAVFKSSGDTLTEAARDATKRISRRLYYAHTNLVVVSEEVAKKDILDIMDALDRDPEFRTTTDLVVARNSSARELVSTLSRLDKLPVNKITKEIKVTERMLGENMSISVDDFLNGLVSIGKQPIANGFKLVGNTEDIGTADALQKTAAEGIPAANGIGIFKRGKLAGWVENKNARGVIWILNKVKSTAINLKMNGKKGAISYAPIRSKTDISAVFKNGRPVINVKLENEGWISEANLALDLTKPDVIDKINQAVEKEIKKEVESSIKTVQKHKSDIFGFGEVIHRRYPSEWSKMKGDWSNQFANLKVNVKVDTFVRREGIRTKPFWTDFIK
ncbi:Ger(x)C family spore germination protein [Neobacillus niacini]|uniref:Ger(x)C family spore germination protein n=1 Tax=Neobacillus niacini TaxID=86668 RepID=UPI00286122C8|nr:Ger(x)C family spore germination protein [Neobacillus niacini]MDR7001802.1 spore germination protein KC [Neobacillus niacini]